MRKTLNVWYDAQIEGGEHPLTALRSVLFDVEGISDIF